MKKAKKGLFLFVAVMAAALTGLTLAACGEKDADEHVHELTHVAAVEATCTEPGSLEYWTCSGCGKNFADEGASEELSDVTIPAKGHSPGEAATCTEPQTCTVCGEVIAPAKGHTEAVDAAVAPTCTETGLTEGKHCSVCGEVLVKQEVVKATGHTPAAAVRENVKEATCTEDGSYDEVVYCAVCETELSRKTVEVKATGHVEELRTVAPTCEDCGYLISMCAQCNTIFGVTVDESAPPLGHDLMEHAGKAATCTESGWNAYETCSRCDYTTYEEVPALGHTEGEPVRENEVAAICTEAGSYEEVVYCAVCKAELSREEKEIAALGHTEGEPVRENEVAATCTEAGSYEEVVYCTVCKKELSREEKEIAALGHTEGEPVRENEVAATCTEAGSYEEVVYCTVCKKELSRETKMTGTAGHRYGSWVTVVSATCTTGGSEKRTCSVCGDEDTRSTSALGHDMRSTTVPATCTSGGYTYHSCARRGCNYSYTSNQTSELGHNYESKVTVEATCETKGERLFTCSRCGNSYTEEIPPLNHKFTKDDGTPNIVDHRDPTCTTEGYRIHECIRCHVRYTEPIPALSADRQHYFVNGGCMVCGASEDGSHVHDFVTETVYQNCMEPGEQYEVCASCGYKTGFVKIPAIGEHDFVTETFYQNCEEPGIQYSVCTRCGYETGHTEIPPRGEHELVYLETDEPTCVEPGGKWYQCTFCNIYLEFFLNPLGHDYVDGVCTRCGEAEPASEAAPDPAEGLALMPPTERKSESSYLDSCK